MIVNCPYCEQQAKLIDSIAVYRKSYGMIWHCSDCEAWVGVHKGSKDCAPLGRLANKELRDWKVKAHSVFDPLWQAKIRKEGCSKTKARKAGYKWLADQLNMSVKKCHIGKFCPELCEQVFNICSKFQVTKV